MKERFRFGSGIEIAKLEPEEDIRNDARVAERVVFNTGKKDFRDQEARFTTFMTGRRYGVRQMLRALGAGVFAHADQGALAG
jgi:hypothetical protein